MKLTPVSFFLVAGTVLAQFACSGGGGGGNPAVAAVQPPVFTSTAPTAAKEGHPYAYAPTASDPAGKPISFTLPTSPAGASFSAGAVAWTPSAAQVGAAQSFSLQASNGGASASQSWTVMPSANAKPAWTSPTPASTAREGVAYSAALAASDADGDPVSFVLVAGPQGAAIAAGTLSWTPGPAQTGAPQTFTVEARDGFGGATARSWTVTASSNQAPLFSSTPPTALGDGQSLTYAAAATDPDGDAISFALLAGPNGAALAPNGTLTWTPTAAQRESAQAFSLRAIDSYGASTIQSWTLVPARTLNVTGEVRFVMDGHTTLAPFQFVGNTIGAYQPNGSGGFTHYPGLGDVGGFHVFGLPAGPAWIKEQTPGGYAVFLWTDRNDLDWGWNQLGRPDVIWTQDSDYFGLFNLNGLLPFEAGEQPKILVPNTGMYTWLNLGSGLLGQTSLDTIGRWKWSSRPVWGGAAKGDVGYLLQTRPTGSPRGPYETIQRAFSGPIQAAAETNWDWPLALSPMTVVAPSQSLVLHWNADQIGPLTAQVHPSAALQERSFALQAHPYGLAHGQIQEDLGELLVMRDPTGSGVVNLGSVGYGNPFPGTWPLLANVRAWWSLSVKAAAASTSATLWLRALTPSTTLPSAGNPAALTLGPVQSPTLNDQSAFARREGVGVQPTLAWNAPLLGAPTGYQVLIQRLDVSGSSTRLKLVAVLYTAERSVQVPPTVLEAGKEYVAIITAVQSPGFDARKAVRSRGVDAYADAATSIFVP